MTKLCPGGFEACSLWDYKDGYKCAYALCKYWAGLSSYEVENQRIASGQSLANFQEQREAAFLKSEDDFKIFYGEPSLAMKPWSESKLASYEDKLTANKCPTCGRRYRKKKKAAPSGPTPLEEYIEEQKRKEDGRPYDDDLPW